MTRSALKEAILARLDTIPEPCSIAMRDPMSLVEMGLIEDIVLDPQGAVTVTLCLTDPGCVHFNGMRAYIADAITTLPGVNSVNVCQTLDTLWTDERVRRRAT
ncbi:MAG: DUF59 domain-containing protein [Novosphingobium sp.]|nr:DUF59 domain-containing protein [Novosphingobium sp.]